VRLVIADDHKGLRAAARRVFNATHQRCRIHWMRNALAHALAKQRAAVAAMLKTIFAQETKADAEAQWTVVADALREKQPKIWDLMDASRDDVLAYMVFPREHSPQIAIRVIARIIDEVDLETGREHKEHYQVPYEINEVESEDFWKVVFVAKPLRFTVVNVYVHPYDVTRDQPTIGSGPEAGLHRVLDQELDFENLAPQHALGDVHHRARHGLSSPRRRAP
jgi:hypothetical protein